MAETFSVIVHPFESATPYSNAYELRQLSTRAPQHALVFIGGLGDGPHTVPYIRSIAADIERAPAIDYSVFEFRMASSFGNFGWNSLKRDAEDIAALVKYLRSIGKTKVVLMGHSTGCQDCMEYATKGYQQTRPVDGFILQAPASDRELFASMPEDFTQSIAQAKELIDLGRGTELLPVSPLASMMPAPITAYRWYSLAAVGGDDDYFSADLSDEKVSSIWSKVDKPVLIVPSGEDEYVPDLVGIPMVMKKWEAACKPDIVSKLSAMIPGANHQVQQLDAQVWLAQRVIQFLGSL